MGSWMANVAKAVGRPIGSLISREGNLDNNKATLQVAKGVSVAPGNGGVGGEDASSSAAAAAAAAAVPTGATLHPGYSPLAHSVKQQSEESSSSSSQGSGSGGSGSQGPDTLPSTSLRPDGLPMQAQQAEPSSSSLWSCSPACTGDLQGLATACPDTDIQLMTVLGKGR